MKLFEPMNELLKKDLIELAQVNTPTWLTVGYIRDWFSLDWIDSYFNLGMILTETEPISLIEQVNKAVQDTAVTFIVIVILLWNMFKLYRAVQHFLWNREDRIEELNEK